MDMPLPGAHPGAVREAWCRWLVEQGAEGRGALAVRVRAEGVRGRAAPLDLAVRIVRHFVRWS
jgi:hypothetical protein